MSLNIDEERVKLIQVINDDTFDFLQFANKNRNVYCSSRINFLRNVLILTIKYPQLELYLKNLLNYFTVDELENTNNWPLIHFMCSDPFDISLNSFKIIINYGININVKYNFTETAIYELLRNTIDDHVVSILKLLIKHGVDLNIVHNYETSLDTMSYCVKELNEETKNCIMTIVDSCGKIFKPAKNNIIVDFIEDYKCSTIKTAIKK